MSNNPIIDELIHLPKACATLSEGYWQAWLLFYLAVIARPKKWNAGPGGMNVAGL